VHDGGPLLLDRFVLCSGLLLLINQWRICQWDWQQVGLKADLSVGLAASSFESTEVHQLCCVKPNEASRPRVLIGFDECSARHIVRGYDAFKC
jgi:hypothetical protein